MRNWRFLVSFVPLGAFFGCVTPGATRLSDGEKSNYASDYRHPIEVRAAHRTSTSEQVTPTPLLPPPAPDQEGGAPAPSEAITVRSPSLQSASDHKAVAETLAESVVPNGENPTPNNDGLPEQFVDYSSGYKEQSAGCPAIPEMADWLAHPKKACGGQYNQAVLREIARVKPGGGYSLKGPVTNLELKLSTKAGALTIANARNGTSYCSGATYSIFLRTVQGVAPKTFKAMNDRQLKSFRLGNNDNQGFWGAWNNDGIGSADSNRLVRWGDNFRDSEAACPGDFLHLDRKNKSGHSVVYLGKRDGKIYYWSSQGSTDGYGIHCESVNNFDRMDFTRMTQPQNLANIAEYDGRPNVYASGASVTASMREPSSKVEAKVDHPNE